MPVYAEHLRNIIKQGVDRKDNFDKPLEGFKVAVDPGNGAGGYFATDVLQPLGCDVSGQRPLFFVFSLLDSSFNKSIYSFCVQSMRIRGFFKNI